MFTHEQMPRQETSRTMKPSTTPSPSRPPVLKLAALLATPLIPDDYIELLNPLWTRHSLRARVEAITPETPDSASLTLKPGPRWQGHQPGQFLRVGVDLDGVRHWRCYSISSAPERADGRLQITVKAVDGGRVSQYLVRELKVGALLELAAAEGEFVQPETLDAPLLFVTAGSGITPVMSQLRHFAALGAMPECTLVHYAPSDEQVIFGAELRALAERYPQFKLHLQFSRGEAPAARFGAESLAKLCPDWQRRRTYSCGPAGLLATVESLWAEAGAAERLTVERFRPALASLPAGGTVGGRLRFCRSGAEADSDGRVSILESAEQAGLAPAHGCRMGICHGCTAPLKSGQVRDLRDGRIHAEEGDLIQICVCAPVGDAEFDL